MYCEEGGLVVLWVTNSPFIKSIEISLFLYTLLVTFYAQNYQSTHLIVHVHKYYEIKTTSFGLLKVFLLGKLHSFSQFFNIFWCHIFHFLIFTQLLNCHEEDIIQAILQ